MLIDLVMVGVGLVLLTKAADQFVLGAARIALILRISAVVVGAVIVGFGTSAPEMLVSGIAAWQGDPEVGAGNIIGSNVANLSLVLGTAVLFIPLAVTGSVIRKETPLMLASVLLFAWFVQGGIAPVEAIILLIALAIAVGFLIKTGSSTPDPELEADVASFADRARMPRLRTEVVRTGIGLIGTLVGAQLLVMGAVDIADAAGFSGGFVGFTLVAVGTSLPELVTAISAARAGEGDLIIGNLLGSNLFNSLGVGAVLALAGTAEIDAPRLMTVGVGAMIVVAVGVWLMMVTQRRIVRMEGVALLGIYIAAVVMIGPSG